MTEHEWTAANFKASTQRFARDQSERRQPIDPNRILLEECLEYLQADPTKQAAGYPNLVKRLRASIGGPK